MVPINQVIVGGDPLLGSSMVNNNIEEQLEMLERYKRNLEAARQAPQRLVWDEVDAEINPLTEEQKALLLEDAEYVDTYTRIQSMVQHEILNLVKARIEGTPEGKELLQNQLRIVRKLKGKIIQDTNREIEVFRKFREYSKEHPTITYEEFIKTNIA